MAGGHPRRILGVSCDYHDSAAAIIDAGDVVAAAQEERFSRRKHDSTLPVGAIDACLSIAGIELGDVDAVVVHEKPLAVAGRVLAARQRRGPAALGGFVREFPTLLRRNLLVGYRIESVFRRGSAGRVPPIYYGEHHLSHAAAAYLPSPFDRAAILTVDGIGEWATASVGVGSRHRIELLSEQRFPNSLGLLYSLVTAWCGFRPNDGEYKLMGLAPYGEPTYADALAELMELRSDGSIVANERLTELWGSPPEKMRRLHALLGGPPRSADREIGQREHDLARSAQDYAERALLAMARHAHEVTGERQLVLGGGVALNCVANGRVLRDGPFDAVWVPPAPGDSGSAVGAALWYWHCELGHHREPDGLDRMCGAQLGPSWSSDEVAEVLAARGVRGTRVADVRQRCEIVAERLAEGAIVGWFQGRMEFGPRALGNRSILADPRDASMQRTLNDRVKRREGFRPFAPVVMWEHAPEWFEIDRPMPYMTFTATVRGDRIPACTHVDGSARVQTVDAGTNPPLHALLDAFERRTGCPVLLNTSFNGADEPIVCSPGDALDTAERCGLDLVVIEDHLIEIPSGAPGAARSAAEDRA